MLSFSASRCHVCFFFSSHQFSHLSFLAQSICIWSHCFFIIWACVYLTRGAVAWLAGWAALPAPELVLSSKNSSGDHDYINRWRWKDTCRGSFSLQNLLSYSAIQEVDESDFLTKMSSTQLFILTPKITPSLYHHFKYLSIIKKPTEAWFSLVS